MTLWIKHSSWPRQHVIETEHAGYLGTPCGLDILVYPKDTRNTEPPADERCLACMAWLERWRPEAWPELVRSGSGHVYL